MRRKVLVTLLCLTFSVCVMACGSKDASTEQTATNTPVEETETVETEVVATESVETTEVQESEIEVVETEAEAVVETETQQSLELTYEDFACEYQGYTNFIDFDQNTSEKHEIQIVYGQLEDETYYLPAENDSTARGLKLGDSKERVIELYGDYDRSVVYRNMRLKYGDLVPAENYVYFLDGYKTAKTDNVYAFIVTLDTNGNVLAILYGW